MSYSSRSSNGSSRLVNGSSNSSRSSEWVNIPLRRVLYNHGNIARGGSPTSCSYFGSTVHSVHLNSLEHCSLYEQSRWQSYPSRPRFEPGTFRLKPRSIRMSHQGRPVVVVGVVVVVVVVVYIWILLYVAFCTIIAISRQKEAQSPDYALLLFRMTSRVLYSA